MGSPRWYSGVTSRVPGIPSLLGGWLARQDFPGWRLIDSLRKQLSEVAVKLVRRSPLHRKFTVEDVNYRLQKKALGLGASTVANVVYTEDDGSKLLASHAGSIEAKGLAIIDASDRVACPFCAEKIKRVARKCKHCGSELPQVP